MKKIIFGTVVVFIVIISAALYYVFTNLDAIVEVAIEKFGSEATQTAVRVDKVGINLVDGAGSIYGLTVANPKEFDVSHVLSLGEVGVVVDLESLTTDVIVIDKIIVHKPEIFFQMTADKKDNMSVLLGNINKSSTPSDNQPGKKTNKNEAAGEAPKLRIRHLLFTDGIIQTKIAPEAVPIDIKSISTFKLLKIDMRDLGGKQGATPDKIAEQIISRLLSQAKNQVKQKIKDLGREKLDAKKAEAKAKIEAKKQEIQDEEKAKVKDKLKNLFGR